MPERLEGPRIEHPRPRVAHDSLDGGALGGSVAMDGAFLAARLAFAVPATV